MLRGCRVLSGFAGYFTPGASHFLAAVGFCRVFHAGLPDGDALIPYYHRIYPIASSALVPSLRELSVDLGHISRLAHVCLE